MSVFSLGITRYEVDGCNKNSIRGLCMKLMGLFECISNFGPASHCVAALLNPLAIRYLVGSKPLL